MSLVGLDILQSKYEIKIKPQELRISIIWLRGLDPLLLKEISRIGKILENSRSNSQSILQFKLF